MLEDRKFPKYSDPILALMDREDEMVTAADIAPIIRMHPDVIIKYAKTGKWPREICNYIVSGTHVKFFRIDFLKKGGWLS
ncbi:MAG: hypothetical protein J6S83_04455 [Lachnospiraceae bacterium]|nr:hypothetical protein [Lachnospiraceae bacterium]